MAQMTVDDKLGVGKAYWTVIRDVVLCGGGHGANKVFDMLQAETTARLVRTFERPFNRAPL